jgi:hypothetical protein
MSVHVLWMFVSGGLACLLPQYSAGAGNLWTGLRHNGRIIDLHLFHMREIKWYFHSSYHVIQIQGCITCPQSLAVFFCLYYLSQTCSLDWTPLDPSRSILLRSMTEP